MTVHIRAISSDKLSLWFYTMTGLFGGLTFGFAWVAVLFFAAANVSGLSPSSAEDYANVSVFFTAAGFICALPLIPLLAYSYLLRRNNG